MLKKYLNTNPDTEHEFKNKSLNLKLNSTFFLLFTKKCIFKSLNY